MIASYHALRPLRDDWDLIVGADTGTYMSAVRRC